MLLRIVYKRVVTQKKGQPSHVMRTQQKARVGMYNSQGDTPTPPCGEDTYSQLAERNDAGWTAAIRSSWSH